MKKYILPLLLVLFIVLVGYYNLNKDKFNLNPNTANTQEKLTPLTSWDERVGTTAPNFTLYNIEGEKVSLSDFKGKKVVLNFWASWCGPCGEEMPLLNKISKENQDKYMILTVNLSEDKKTVKEFLNKNNYTFKVVLDTEGEVGDIYRISRIPTTFFVDENGIIKNIKTGILNDKDMQNF